MPTEATADTVVIADEQLRKKGIDVKVYGRESVVCDEDWQNICECCGGEEHLLQYMGVEDKRDHEKVVDAS